MTQFIGFVIAAIVGLTGIGGGSFTTPALILLLGLPVGEAVGTAMFFAAALRMLAAPVYLLRQQVHAAYFWALVLGALPGLFIGTWILHRLRTASFSPIVLLSVGLLLVMSSALTLSSKFKNQRFARDRRYWLSILAVPIGIETGFSSAGAGALGTILLLNFSELTPAQVVGTDLLFGLVLALAGSAFHFGWGSVDQTTLLHLLYGGLPGILIGCIASRAVSGRKLRTLLALIGIALGLQLAWLGSRAMIRSHSEAVALKARKDVVLLESRKAESR